MKENTKGMNSCCSIIIPHPPGSGGIIIKKNGNLFFKNYTPIPRPKINDLLF